MKRISGALCLMAALLFFLAAQAATALWGQYGTAEKKEAEEGGAPAQYAFAAPVDAFLFSQTGGVTVYAIPFYREDAKLVYLNGEKVQVLDALYYSAPDGISEWLHIAFTQPNGVPCEGYAEAALVRRGETPAAPVTLALPKDAPLYLDQALTGKTVAALKQGTAVTVRAIAQDYYLVEADGKTGYLHRDDTGCPPSLAALEPDGFSLVPAGHEQRYEEYLERLSGLYQRWNDADADTLAQRAEETELKIAYGYYDRENREECFHFLPEKVSGALSERDAIEKAQALLPREAEHTLAYGAVSTAFYAEGSPAEEPRWHIEFEAPLAQHGWTVVMDKAGGGASIEKSPYVTLYDTEGRFLTDALHSLPDAPKAATDISADRAVAIALDAMGAALDRATDPSALRVRGGLKLLSGRRVWLVRLSEQDDAALAFSGPSFDVALDARTEEKIYVSPADSYAWELETRAGRKALLAKLNRDGSFLNWPMEELVEYFPHRIAPVGANDITAEKAIGIARRAVQEQGAFSDRFFERYRAYALPEVHDAGPSARAWHIAFFQPEDIDRLWASGQGVMGCNAYVDMETGELLSVHLPREMSPASFFYTYTDGLLELLSMERPTYEYTLGITNQPGKDAIRREEAVKKAEEAFAAACPDSSLAQFERSVRHVLQRGQGYYVVTFSPAGEGTPDPFRVVVADSGALAAVDAPRDPQPANDRLWTLTARQKAEQMPGQYGLPREGDITQEEAMRIARDVLESRYFLSEEEIERYTPLPGLSIAGTRLWEIAFFPTELAVQGIYTDCYWVDIDAATGDVLSYTSPDESNG